METSFELFNGISVDIEHFAPLAVGSEMYRIIYAIKEVSTGRLHKFYEIWLSQEYVDDKKRLQRSATKDEILTLANDYLRKRFKESNNTIPSEGGAFLTNELGEALGNPRTFQLKLSDQVKPKYVTTTIRIPEETHRWLKVKSGETGLGMGDLIRQTVATSQAGTASYQGNLDQDV